MNPISSLSSVNPGQNVNFVDLVSAATSSAFDGIRAGDVASQKAVLGQISTQEAVEAVLSAERTLQTTLAVRDKMIEAYQDVMRMPI
jgi:flagellar hook-basal body complex protein FliE